MLIDSINYIFLFIIIFKSKGYELKYKFVGVLYDIFLTYIKGMSSLQFKMLIRIISERFDCLQRNLNQIVSKSTDFKLKNEHIIFENSYLHRSLCKIIPKINSMFGYQLLLYIMF